MHAVRLSIHNYRSIQDATIDLHDYTLLMGANNAGKSTIINAVRLFYDDLKWSDADVPKRASVGGESYVEITFELGDVEWSALPTKYRGSDGQSLTVRRYFRRGGGAVRGNQSNLFAVVDGELSAEQFFGARNVGSAKLGSIVYIPAVASTSDQMKTSGPSPLRTMLSFVMNKAVQGSRAFRALRTAIEELNAVANDEDGFLTRVSEPINEGLRNWNVSMSLSVRPLEPMDVARSLTQLSFQDPTLDTTGMAIEQFGQGFQRSVIYELIKAAAAFGDDDQFAGDSTFSGRLTMILFEEPEAFLHPNQQASMAKNLRQLGHADGQQVVVTTHAPVFVSKSTDDLRCMARVSRANGVSQVAQPVGGDIENVVASGAVTRRALRALAAATTDHEVHAEVKRLLDESDDEQATAEEVFRHQLWLDAGRSAAFFADRVLLVEGDTERALLDYLFDHDWAHAVGGSVYVMPVFGKFNCVRYMALLDVFRVPYGVLVDADDITKVSHRVQNAIISNHYSAHRLAEPQFVPGDLEALLGVPMPKRDQKKPVWVLKAAIEGEIDPGAIERLRALVEQALAVDRSGAERAPETSRVDETLRPAAG